MRTFILLNAALAGLFCVLPANGQELKTPSRWVDPETGRQRLITVSPETTVVVEPLDEMGFPDYVSALNERGKGIKPEENAAVDLCRIFGPVALKANEEELTDGDLRYRKKICDDLGMDTSETPILESTYPDYVEEIVQKIEDPDRQEELRERLLKGYAEYKTWKREQNPELFQWLERESTREAIQLIDLMSTKRSFFWPRKTDQPEDEMQLVYNVHMSYADNLRTVGRILLTLAMLDLGEGRYDSASDRLIQIHNLADLLRQQPFLVEQLVCVALHSTAYRGDIALAQDTKVPMANLKSHETRLSEVSPKADVINAILFGERFCHLNFVCHLAQRDALGRSRCESMFDLAENENPIGWVQRLLDLMDVDYNELLRLTNLRYQELEKINSLSALEKLKECKRIEALNSETRVFFSKWSTLGRYFIAGSRFRAEWFDKYTTVMLLEGTEKALPLTDHLKMKDELIRVLYALERYQREEGRYPEELNSLVPKHLASIPVDRFSGKELIYDLNFGEYQLYSIGKDPKETATRESGVYFTSAGWNE